MFSTLSLSFLSSWKSKLLSIEHNVIEVMFGHFACWRVAEYWNTLSMYATRQEECGRRRQTRTRLFFERYESAILSERYFFGTPLKRKSVQVQSCSCWIPNYAFALKKPIWMALLHMTNKFAVIFWMLVPVYVAWLGIITPLNVCWIVRIARAINCDIIRMFVCWIKWTNEIRGVDEQCQVVNYFVSTHTL